LIDKNATTTKGRNLDPIKRFRHSGTGSGNADAFTPDCKEKSIALADTGSAPSTRDHNEEK
jgi:hypothetical protein